jgi:hypothetical protein
MALLGLNPERGLLLEDYLTEVCRPFRQRPLRSFRSAADSPKRWSNFLQA